MPSDEMVEKVARAKAMLADIVNLPYELHAPLVRFMEFAEPETLAQLRAALAAAAAEAGEQPVAWGVHRMTVEPQEDGTWFATCPDLPGCIATADTPDVALSRLREAQASWLAVCHERGIKVPEPATAIRARGDATDAGEDQAGRG